MIPRFGPPVAQLCMIFNQVVDTVDLLNDFNQPLDLTFLNPMRKQFKGNVLP